MGFRNKRNGDIFLIGDDVIIDVDTEHQGLGSSDAPADALGDATPPLKPSEAGRHRSRVIRPIAGLALGGTAIALVSIVVLGRSGGGQPVEEPQQPAASAEVSLAAPAVASAAAPIPEQAPKPSRAPSNDSARESGSRRDRDRKPLERPDGVSSSPASSSPAPSPPVAAIPSPSSGGGSGGGENFGIEE